MFKNIAVSSYARVGLLLTAVESAVPAHALDGNSVLQLSTGAGGWGSFELVTQGNDISAISDAGYGTTASRGTYDGLGAYRTGNTLSIFVCHEVTDNAAISRVDVDLKKFRQAIDHSISGGATPFPDSFVTGIGYAYDTIYDGTYHAISNAAPVASGTVDVGNYSDANFSRFCSGTSYAPGSFSDDRGFADQVFITGEEVFNNTGRFFALDPTTRTLWEAPDLGGGSWENAALVDTGNTTHTALYLSEDNTGSRLQLYIGEKGVDANGDGEIDFLERNGLRGGTRYYFIPDAGASTTDLPDGAVSGKWSTSTTGALTEDKLEDAHTNPADGTELVLADQTDGVYLVDLDLQFTAGSLDTAASSAHINQIIPESGDDSLGNPDNVTWSADGKIYVQQDGAGNGIWQVDPDGTNRVLIANALSEPSGIYDVSETIGYRAGSVMLSSVQGDGGSGAQLTAIISPNAALNGDLNADGFVGVDDLNTVLVHWNQNVTPSDNSMGDATGDGFVGVDDMNIILVNWNNGTPPGASANIPEPGTVSLLAFTGAAALQRRRAKTGK